MAFVQNGMMWIGFIDASGCSWYGSSHPIALESKSSFVISFSFSESLQIVSLELKNAITDIR